MSITIRLPSVLKVAVGAEVIAVTGATVREALDVACDAYPRLRHHILQDDGQLKPHVLCLVNERSLPRETFGDHVLEAGDEIQIFQAITGG